MDRSEIARREDRWRPKKLYHTSSELASIQPPSQGIPTGWDYIDDAIMALQPNRLNMFVGYLSHGKTAGMCTVIVNNMKSGNDLLTVYASGDDSPESLLWKFIAMHDEVSSQWIIKESSPEWRRNRAAELFDGRLVIATPETSFNIDKLGQLVDQVQQDYGRSVDMLCYDYLGTLDEAQNGTSVRAAAVGFKRLVRLLPDTVVVVGHQCNRQVVSGGAKGLETRHVEFGGVVETDGVMIGFRRRIDTEELEDSVRDHESHVPTTNVSVMKNKVTGRRTSVEGKRFTIDPICGIIREQTRAEQFHNLRSIEEAPSIRFKERGQ